MLERKLQLLLPYRCRQFVPGATSCADKTLLTLNVLNSYAHAPAAHPNRFPSASLPPFSQFGRAAEACACEFKTLRVNRILSAQLVAPGTKWLH